jgi:hypothetical protein
MRREHGCVCVGGVCEGGGERAIALYMYMCQFEAGDQYVKICIDILYCICNARSVNSGMIGGRDTQKTS